MLDKPLSEMNEYIADLKLFMQQIVYIKSQAKFLYKFYLPSKRKLTKDFVKEVFVGQKHFIPNA